METVTNRKKISCVRTPLPGPQSKALFERWAKVEAQCTGYQAQLSWKTGKGVVITDADDNQYIDWTSGVLVANVGHCHPRLVEAIQTAATKLLNNYECLHETRVIAAEKLVSVLPPHLDKCFFLSTGAEAVEAATRIMKRRSGKFEIVSFQGGFHGRTYAGLTAGGLAGPKKGYGPTIPGAIRAPYPYCYRCPFKCANPETCGQICFDYIEDVVQANTTDSLAGLIVEPYQGSAGFVFPPDGWLTKVEQWCRAKGITFTLDEVQSAYGRTGKFWAMEWEGLTPDLVCIAKGLGSSVPVSAIAGRSEVLGCLDRGEMSSTMGGNPVSSAAVIAVVDIMQDENLPANALKIGKVLKKGLLEIKERCPYVGDVRGRGMVMGVELVKDKKTKEPAPDLTRKLIDVAAQEGLLIGSVGLFGSVIRVAPPLVMTEDEALESLELFEAALSKL